MVEIDKIKKAFNVLGILKIIFGGLGLIFAFLYLFPATGNGLKDLPVDRNLTYSTMGLHISISAFIDIYMGYLFKTATKRETNCNILLILIVFESLGSIITYINNTITNSFIPIIINFILLYFVVSVRFTIYNKKSLR